MGGGGGEGEGGGAWPAASMGGRGGAFSSVAHVSSLLIGASEVLHTLQVLINATSLEDWE